MIYRIGSNEHAKAKRYFNFVDKKEIKGVIITFRVNSARLELSSKNNRRPYMLLYGDIKTVTLPHGLPQKFIPEHQDIFIRYEFSDEELSNLVIKGLFYDGFSIPDIISNNEGIEFPIDTTVEKYTYQDNIYAFIDLNSSQIYDTNTKHCGYTFGEYFDDQNPHKLETKFGIEAPEQVADDTITKEDEKIDDVSIEKEHEDDDDLARLSSIARYQEKRHQADIKPIMQTLLEQNKVIKKERERLDHMDEKSKSLKAALKDKPELSPDKSADDDLFNMDDELAAFSRAQEKRYTDKNIADAIKNIPIVSDSELDAFVRDAEAEVEKEAKEAESEKIIEMAAKSDASVNISVADNDGDTAESRNDKSELDEIASVSDDDKSEAYDDNTPAKSDDTAIDTAELDDDEEDADIDSMKINTEAIKNAKNKALTKSDNVVVNSPANDDDEDDTVADKSEGMEL